MDSKDTQKARGIMAKLRNSKGFSLIEMAIVLVIIGIIIAAIIKGQDLIVNSRAKKVISAVTSWRNLNAAFLDRNGRFPGDEAKNGIIGDETTSEQSSTGSATAELSTFMPTAPDNPIIVGASAFYVYFGNIDLGATSGSRNTMLVCGDPACANVFTPEHIEIIKALDTSIDGIAEAAAGQVRAVTTAPTLVPAAPVLGSAINGRWVATFTATALPIDTTSLGTGATAWTTTYRAALWSFDKPF